MFTFPELRSFLKRFLPEGDEILGLNLKSSAAGVTFNSTVEEAFLRKYPTIYQALTGGVESWSGEIVTIETALQNSVVWACNQLVAGTIGALPASLKQDNGSGIRDAKEHPLYEVVANEPNEESSSQDLIELITSHCLLSGNGYAQIIRRSGTGVAIGLRELMPQNVQPSREKSGQKRKVYVVSESGLPDKTYTIEHGKPQGILHLRGIGWDGLRGYSVIPMARNSLGSIIAADKNASRFWAEGGRIPFLVEMTQPFRAGSGDAKTFREDLEAITRDPHRVPLLEPGMKYVKTGSTMVDAQSIEFRKASVPDVCRWFDVMPSMVGDLTGATYNNTEEFALQFEKISLSKWLRRWRQEFRRCVLTPEEKAAGYYFHQNLDALRRGDFLKRIMGYATALQNAWLNIDEVRALEERNPLPDGAGKHHHIQLNMGTVGKDGVVLDPQSPEANKAGALFRIH